MLGSRRRALVPRALRLLAGILAPAGVWHAASSPRRQQAVALRVLRAVAVRGSPSLPKAAASLKVLAKVVAKVSISLLCSCAWLNWLAPPLPSRSQQFSLAAHSLLPVCVPFFLFRVLVV